MSKRLWFFLTCLMISASMTFAQRTATGVVTYKATGEPIIGATVLIERTSTGVVTDLNGRFTINSVPENARTLKISYVGMEDLEVFVGTNLKVKMVPVSITTDDVIIVAYGTQKKESLVGAVNQINSEKIEQRTLTTATGALEGAASGIQVNSTYGEPGTDPEILIRGVGTINGITTPLYILDGAQFNGNLAELNPIDIESMTVLKDAAATAIYGNRASNGVVIITTKRGKGGAIPTMTLNINQGMYNRGIPEYERMNANQFMETAWIAMKNYAQSNEAIALTGDAAKAYATAHVVTDYMRANIYDKPANQLFDNNGKLVANMLPGYEGDLDWEDALERTGYRQDYNLSANASGEKFNLYSSIGYLKEKGYVRATDYTRFSGRVNTEYRPTDWLTTGVNLNAVGTKKNYNENATGTHYTNPFSVARYMAPVYAIHAHNTDGSFILDEFGNPAYDTSSAWLNNRNIVYEQFFEKQDSYRNVINGLAYATINLPYDFSFTLKGAVENFTNNGRKYNNPKIGDGATNNGHLTNTSLQTTSYTFNQILNWRHSYGLHNIEALVGHEAVNWSRKYTSMMNVNMKVANLLVANNFLKTSNHYGYDDTYSNESYLGRAAYNYNQKYFSEFSFRRDGSSRFAKDNRWGNFFSFGAAWNMKKEAFLQDVEWLDNLKARASYGEIGNDRGVGYYAYQALYTLDYNGGNPSFVKQQLAANELKWETTQTFDLGFDARLFDRVNVSLGYFDKRSKDLLMAVKLPLSAGSYMWGEDLNLTQLKNIGTISNRGFEIGLDVDVIKKGNLKWNVGLDATLMSNKIVKLANHEDVIVSPLRTYRENHSMYEWYTYHFEGVDQMTGRSLYTLDPEKKKAANTAGALITINGKDYTYQTTYANKHEAGSSMPTVYGAIKSDFKYKDFSLNLIFTYGLGGKCYDGVYQELMSANSSSNAAAYHVDLANSWNGVPDGMTADSPNRINPNGTPILDFTYSTDCNAVSDRWLTSSSCLVFKNINLSYNLPKVVANTLGISGLTVSAGIENLFTLTSRKGLNPQYSFMGEYDNTYVTARTYNLGLTVKF